MSPAEIASYIRYKTSTNSVTFTDSNLLMVANVYLDDLAKRVVDEVDEDYFVVPATTGLVLNQREYPFDSEYLNRIKYVEAKLDGTNWFRLKEMDLNQYGKTTDETTIVNNFSNLEGEAYYTISRKSITIYSGSITTVSAGLKLWYSTYPSHITDMTSGIDLSIDPSTTTHGFPRPLHKILCDQVIIDYKTGSDKPMALTEREQNMEFYIKKALSSMKNANSDRAIIGSIPDSSDRGQEGYDY